jgi:trimethylamine--corrinoid protein Co-methyltransferase
MNHRRLITYKLEATHSQGIDAIHASTLDVLAEVGAFFEDEQAIELLRAAGANVDPDGRVRIPPALIEQTLAATPKELSLYSRDGHQAMLLKPGYVHFGTGSDCPNVIDFETRVRRPSTKRDIETLTRLSDALPNIDFVLSMGYASDVPTDTADLHHFQAMVENTTKPIVITVVEHGNLVQILDLASAIAGGPRVLKERPFVAYFGMPSPPLRHSKTALQNLITCAHHSLPVVYASGTQVGLTGPMSLVGSTVSSNCDVLSGLVVHQLANPGAPFIYGVCIAPFDMKTTIEAYGAPEHYPGDLINVQVAQHYGLPTWGYAGSTDSKALDLQAGLEYLGSTLMGLLSGCNLLHDVGYLESGLCSSCESIVLGNEVIEFARRMLPEVEVDEESLATEIIKRVGIGGTFLMEDHTLGHLRDFWYTSMFDRRRYDEWDSAGRLTMLDRIRSRSEEILSNHRPKPLDSSSAEYLRVSVAESDLGGSRL